MTRTVILRPQTDGRHTYVEAPCDHVPFMHNTLTDRFECLCGQTSVPIGATCPVPPCLCGRPKEIP